jgi:tetratricopeptide (TPR) repeat protein
MKLTSVGKTIMIVAFMAASFISTFGNDPIASKKDELKNLKENLLKASSDSIRVRILEKISYYFTYTNADSSLVYAKMAYKLSKSAHVDIIKAAFYLGSAYDMTNDYENSVKFNLEALQNAQKLNDKTILSNILVVIGYDYVQMNNPEKAVEYFTKALESSVNDKDRFYAVVNLAQIFVGLKEYSKAYNYYEKALALAEKLNMIGEKFSIYSGIGNLYFEQKNYSKSISYYEKTLKNGDTGDYYRQSDALSGIARNCIKTGSHQRGLQCAQQAMIISKRGDFIDGLRDNSFLISQLCEAMHQPTLALDYYKKYVLYKDSIFNKEKDKRISYLQAEFETKQKELQVENLQKEAAFHRKMVYVYLFIVLLVLTILILTIKGIVQKNKKLKIEKELADQRLTIEQEKLRIERDRLIQHQEREMLEKQRLEMELDEKHREILTHAMQIYQQKEVLTSVRSELVNIIGIENSPEIINSVKQLNSEIKSRIDLSDDWTQIKIHFEKVHPLFFNQLKTDFPDLTLHELKLCAYTKLKFNGKEISRLLNITPKSVQMLRYRLKKKMKIPEEENFYDFIVGFDQIIKSS